MSHESPRRWALIVFAGLALLLQPGGSWAADRLVAAFFCPSGEVPFIGELMTPVAAVLEDPKVRAELGLTDDQLNAMTAVETAHDADIKAMLAGTGTPRESVGGGGAEETVLAVSRISADSRRRTSEVLKRRQMQRLQEIVLQRYGVLFVPKRELRQILGLSREQERGIDEIKSRIFAGISETAAPGEAVVAANRCAFATLGGPRIGALLRDGEQAARRLLSSEQARTVERFAGKPFAP